MEYRPIVTMKNFALFSSLCWWYILHSQFHPAVILEEEWIVNSNAFHECLHMIFYFKDTCFLLEEIAYWLNWLEYYLCLLEEILSFWLLVMVKNWWSRVDVYTELKFWRSMICGLWYIIICIIIYPIGLPHDLPPWWDHLTISKLIHYLFCRLVWDC